jgi:hypothetical protein
MAGYFGAISGREIGGVAIITTVKNINYLGVPLAGRSSAGLHFVSVLSALRWRNHLGQIRLLPCTPLRVAPSVRTNAV